MRKSRFKRQGRRGNSVVEFALVSVILVPLLLGTVNVGTNMSRSVQITQLSRDAGHMFVRSVDFTQDGNQNLLVRLGQGLGMEKTSGRVRVTLTRILHIGDNECLSGGREIHECPNHGQSVITQQIVIGNPALRQSNFGEAPAALLGDKNELDADDYLTDTRVIAQGFGNVLALQAGEHAYVAETYFESPEFDFPGFLDGTQIYSKAIF